MGNLDNVDLGNSSSKGRRGRPSIEKKRQERIPLGSRSLKLIVPQRIGFVRRWLNDKSGRIKDAKLGGWTLVVDSTLKVGNASENGNSELGEAVSRIVGLQEGGGPLRAYLMEIPKDWYDEDQYKKRGRRIEVEQAIVRGDDRYDIRDERGQNRGYVPLSGNQITKGF